MVPHITGLVAAPHTPMREDFLLDLDGVDRLARCFIANGMAGAFVCGSTGEGLSLSVPERKAVAQRWQETAAGKVPVIVHVGSLSLPDAKELAAHARQIGAFGIAAMAPCYFRPTAVEDLVDWCRMVASAAPDIPFYYYHLPAMTGVNFPMVDFLRLAGQAIPSLAGIKYSHGDLMDLLRCLRFEDGRYDIMFGIDQQLLSGLACGAAAAVGSTYAYAAPLYRQIIEAWRAGDMKAAQQAQLRAAELVALLLEYPSMAASKAMMKLAGVDCGPVRPPLRNLTGAQFEQLREDLERVGFFDYCCRA
ncbi:MAG: dihydrodipicolinate synthase family protein [Phycisphaerae bacterium]